MLNLDLNTVAMAVIAIANAVAAYFAWRTRQAIEKVHVATNSLTDRLVATTGDERFAAGLKEGREGTKQ